MKAAWVNDLAGSYGTIENAAIWQKVARYDLVRLYLDGRFATAADITSIHRRTKGAGLYLANNWFPGASSFDFARECDAALVRVGASDRQCAIHAQIETPHDPDYVLSFLSEWRDLRPLRATGWVLEGFQSGWFTDPLRRVIAADPNLELYAEAYGGRLQPFQPDAVRSNLVVGGIERRRCLVMYDGDRIPWQWWDGCAFTLERLP